MSPLRVLRLRAKVYVRREPATVQWTGDPTQKDVGKVHAQLVGLSQWYRFTVASLIVRFIRATWRPFRKQSSGLFSGLHGSRGGGLVSRCSIPLASQILSKRFGREWMVFRFRGCLANRMPLAIVSRTNGVPMVRSVRRV